MKQTVLALAVVLTLLIAYTILSGKNGAEFFAVKHPSQPQKPKGRNNKPRGNTKSKPEFFRGSSGSAGRSGGSFGSRSSFGSSRGSRPGRPGGRHGRPGRPGRHGRNRNRYNYYNYSWGGYNPWPYYGYYPWYDNYYWNYPYDYEYPINTYSDIATYAGPQWCFKKVTKADVGMPLTGTTRADWTQWAKYQGMSFILFPKGSDDFILVQSVTDGCFLPSNADLSGYDFVSLLM